jgi:hypothetical protein
MPNVHSLGFGSGKLIEDENGSVSYVVGGSERFRVRIADITSLSITKTDGLVGCWSVNIFGHGALLASTVFYSPDTAKRMEAWFRAHPLFGGQSGAVTQPLSSDLIADELRKLADLRETGVLTDDEFAVQKAKLLGARKHGP